MIYEEELTRKIIAAAIEVHRTLGPGLLESIYEECLCYELRNLGLAIERQKRLPLKYKALEFDCCYRMDLVVCEKVILEIKSVDIILPIHEAQLLTYLKISGIRVGLIFNFNSRFLRHGLKRLVS
jgi:GxxExxY protein